MTKDAFDEKFEEILNRAIVEIREKATQLYHCGGANTVTPSNESYELPRTILIAAMQHNLSLAHPKFIKLAENLKHF